MNLGTFTSIKELWKIYPNGGNGGDSAVVDGSILHWDESSRSWNEVLDPSTPIPGDIQIEGKGVFVDGIETGNYIEGVSGSKIGGDGNADFRQVNADNLYIKDPETNTYVSLASLIQNTGAGLMWEDYLRITIDPSLYFLLYDPSTEETHYTTMQKITEYLEVALDGTGGQVIDIIEFDDNTVISDANVFSARRTIKEITSSLEELDDKYLSKVNPDTAASMIKFTQGLEVGTFSPGVIGGGGRMVMDEGQSKLEIDQLYVRNKATFNEIKVKRAEHISGEQILSAASIICDKVEEIPELYPTHYRCYFDTKDNTIPNYFQVGDLALSRTYNGVSETPPIHLSTFYWREVVEVGADYIDLSASNAATGSSIPVKGDHIVQLGNLTNPERQNAQIWSSVGDRSPSYIQYAGINGFDLQGKERNAIYGDGKGNKLVGKLTVVSGDNTEKELPEILDPMQISEIDVEYARGGSDTVAPESGWVTLSPPKEVGKEYLWSRVKLTFKDNDVKHSTPSYVKEPNGIVSVVEEYYVSSSPTDLEGGTWGEAVPTPSKGVYIWTKTVITLDNGDVSETTPLMSTGFDGKDGTGVAIKPSVATFNDLPPTGNTEGDARIARDTGRLCVWDETLEEWYDAGPFKGDPGPPGTPGADGLDGHSPYIGENGNWFIWDADIADFIDSDDPAIPDDGKSPRISDDGYWETWNHITKVWDKGTVKAKGDTGPKGATGEIGPRGSDGTSVERVIENYAVSSTNEEAPDSGWVQIISDETPLPHMTATNKYLWNYETIVFSDNRSQDTIPVVMGVYGDTGVDGRSVIDIKEQYLVTNKSTGVTRDTAGWKDTADPTTDTEKYLWNYEIITWSSAPITTYVEPIIIGVHGLTGTPGNDGADGISVHITRQGSFRTIWNRYDNDKLLVAPYPTTTIEGGVTIGTIEYVQCRVEIRKGGVDITEQVFNNDDKFDPKWYVNGSLQPNQVSSTLNLSIASANGVNKEVRFQYNDENSINW